MKMNRKKWLLLDVIALTVCNMGFTGIAFGPSAKVIYFGGLSMLFTYAYLLSRELRNMSDTDSQRSDKENKQ